MDTSIDQRLRFIDMSLEYTGRATRAMLVDYFQIGTATASRAFKEYSARWPANAIVLPGKNGGYIRARNYVTAFRHAPEAALELLCFGEVKILLPVVTYGPLSCTLPSCLDGEKVACCTRALVDGTPVRIRYMSSTSGGSERVVHPNHLFQGGGAWYFRAFDEKSGEHRTFRFSRVLDAVEIESEDKTPVDKEWNEEIILSLAPHPLHPNPEAHARDLGMCDRPVVNMRVNTVVAGFLLTDRRVDCSKHGDLDPLEYPLRLMNRAEVSAISSLAIAPGFRK